MTFKDLFHCLRCDNFIDCKRKGRPARFICLKSDTEKKPPQDILDGCSNPIITEL